MAPLQSWVDVDPKSHFSIYNIPFGIITTADNKKPRPAIAIGDEALDLAAFTEGNGFSALSTIQPYQSVFFEPTLNAFAALTREYHTIVREYLQSVLLAGGPFPEILQRNFELRKKALIQLDQVENQLPMKIGDYTDFYAGLNHAHNVGTLFRGAENALQPNYMHLPVGYHGRASSVVVSGTPIQRPNGQILENPGADVKQPILAPSRKLDFELELGCFVCANSDMGDVIRIEDAPDYLFGMVLMNDWSARDIQAWEYQPLGPVHSKNFGTTISPWVVLMDALEPFATHGIPSKTKPLPYLDEKKRENHFDIDLKVNITTQEGKTTTVSETSSKNLLFSFPQMLAHHTIGGCPFNVGDLLGSGTISGRADDEKGCLLEMSGNGEKEIQLAGGEKRTYLADYDEVAISGVCGSEPGALVGFGECSGTLEPATELKFE
jgi:fumarylacetoacetase